MATPGGVIVSILAVLLLASHATVGAMSVYPPPLVRSPVARLDGHPADMATVPQFAARVTDARLGDRGS